MPLLDEIQEALTRLKSAEAARSGVEESQALEEQRKTVSEKHDALERLVLRAELLRRNRVATTPPSGLEQLRTRLQSVATQFREAPVAATLRSSRRISALTTSLNALVNDVGKTQAADWHSFYSSKLFGGPTPTSIKARLALTPKNKEALARYTALFASFGAFRNKIPESQAEFDQVNADSRTLGKITFEESVPSDVAKFFAATASDIGASLEMLTPEVLRWLRDNHLLEKYVVRALVE